MEENHCARSICFPQDMQIYPHVDELVLERRNSIANA